MMSSSCDGVGQLRGRPPRHPAGPSSRANQKPVVSPFATGVAARHGRHAVVGALMHANASPASQHGDALNTVRVSLELSSVQVVIFCFLSYVNALRLCGSSYYD